VTVLARRRLSAVIVKGTARSLKADEHIEEASPPSYCRGRVLRRLTMREISEVVASRRFRLGPPVLGNADRA
jgi:hypothetical protein